MRDEEWFTFVAEFQQRRHEAATVDDVVKLATALRGVLEAVVMEAVQDIKKDLPRG